MSRLVLLVLTSLLRVVTPVPCASSSYPHPASQSLALLSFVLLQFLTQQVISEQQIYVDSSNSSNSSTRLHDRSSPYYALFLTRQPSLFASLHLLPNSFTVPPPPMYFPIRKPYLPSLHNSLFTSALVLQRHMLLNSPLFSGIVGSSF